MGFSESALQAVHEVQAAIECLERAADTLQPKTYPSSPSREDYAHLIEKLMAQRRHLAELACEIAAMRQRPRI